MNRKRGNIVHQMMSFHTSNFQYIKYYKHIHITINLFNCVKILGAPGAEIYYICGRNVRVYVRDISWFCGGAINQWLG